MKRCLPFLLLFLCFQLFSQCTVDPTFVDSLPGVYPPPCYTPDDIDCGMDPGVAGEAYEFVFQIVVGEEVTIVNPPGTFELNSIRIDPEDAFVNLPAGLDYACFPENCTFLQNTLGCVLIHGVPEEINGTDLKFIAEVALLDSQLIIVDTVPGTLTGGGSYFLDVISDVENHHYTPFSVELAPNPTQGTSIISIESEIRNELTLDILNLTGEVIKSQTYQIEQGANSFELDLSKFSNGMYFYAVGNEEGVLTDRIIVAKD